MTISPPKSSSPTADRPVTRFDVWTGALFVSVMLLFSVMLFFIVTFGAREGGVTADVNRVAAEVEAAVINDPDATSFEYVPTGKNSKVGTLVVGDAPAVTFEASTRHINISIYAVDGLGAKVENGDPTAVPGEYIIEAYYTQDWGWGGGTAANPITYESRLGEVVES